MVDWIWPSLTLMLGLGLLIAEVALPVGGLIGVLAVASLAGSVFLAYTSSATLGLWWGGLEVVMVPATWLATLYSLPRTKLGRRVYLAPPTVDDLGAKTPADQVGTSGRVLTPLRPSGMIDVAGRRVEAMAESGLIGAGVWVKVVAVRSGRVVVREE